MLQPGPGTVAVILHPNGVEEIVKTSVPTQQGVLFPAPDGAVVTVKDNSKYFSDINSHWARDAIGFVSARELFQGETASDFAPNGSMSRAMMMTVLARLDGAETEGPAAVWYEPGMQWAVSRGVSDGTNPDGRITREQLAVMLYRYAGSPASTGRTLPFQDAAQISGYAGPAMEWAVAQGILTGSGAGQLLPGGEATRAEAAAMLMRYLKVLNP